MTQHSHYQTSLLYLLVQRFPRGFKQGVPEDPANSDGQRIIEPGEEQDLEQGELFPETLYVQEPLSNLVPTPSEPVLLNSPAESGPVGSIQTWTNRPSVECEA